MATLMKGPRQISDDGPEIGAPEARQSPVQTAAARRADKVALRRDELAHATLKTLADLGYARTSMRDIAANSGYSHGVLHYYFADKTDLILHCVRVYKAACVTRYDDLIEKSASEQEFATAVPQRLADTLVEDLDMHRLWYDIRSQSVFEPTLVFDVRAIDAMLQQMIWRIVTRYGELAGREPAVDAPTAYAIIDGVFYQALIRHCYGDDDALEQLKSQAAGVLAKLLK